MSRIAVLACALLLTSAGWARAGVRVGLEAGRNEGRATWSAGAFDYDPEFCTSGSIGLAFEAPLRRRFSLAAELRYLEIGDRTFIEDLPRLYLKRQWAWRYLDLPVHVRYRPLAHHGLFVSAGPEAAYLLAVHPQTFTGIVLAGTSAATANRPAQPTAQIYEDLGTFFSNQRDAYYPWNLALTGGLGWEVGLGRHLGNFEVRYTHGLTDIARAGSLVRRTEGVETLLGFLW